jgi:hypothetical protein
MMNGSLLQWAIDREGDVKERMRADVDTLLRPRRVPSTRNRRRRLPRQCGTAFATRLVS